MISNPIVSVVLPTYNGCRYIRGAIESVMKQTMTDWQLIIVNDGSTDNTYDILNEYESMDERILVVDKKINSGLPRGLNEGFSYASGKYLTWTSDDNLFLPDALVEMSEYLDKNHDVSMVCANMSIIDEQGRYVEDYEKYHYPDVLVYNCVGACFMYRAEVLQTVGEYDPDMIYVEDYDYWLRIIKELGGIGHLDKQLYQYRRHVNRLAETRKKEIQIQDSRLLLGNFDWIIKELKQTDRLLSSLYAKLIERGVSSSDKTYIEKYIPETKYDRLFETSRPLILYGAGRTAIKALNVIPNDQISFIADRNPAAYRGAMNNITVISREELAVIHKDYNILISVGGALLLEVMRDLLSVGITHFCSFVNYISNKQEDME